MSQSRSRVEGPKRKVTDHNRKLADTSAPGRFLNMSIFVHFMDMFMKREQEGNMNDQDQSRQFFIEYVQKKLNLLPEKEYGTIIKIESAHYPYMLERYNLALLDEGLDIINSAFLVRGLSVNREYPEAAKYIVVMVDSELMADIGKRKNLIRDMANSLKEAWTQCQAP